MTTAAPRSVNVVGNAPQWQPWGWCNLCRNPFGEFTREERVELAVVNLDPALRHLRETDGTRVAVQWLGDCGRGKTTHLLALASQLPESHYVYLDEEAPCPAIPAANPLLIDEAQRMPRAVRRRVLSSGCSLVLATHRDLSRPLRRAGYRILSEKIGSRTDARLVTAIVSRRIEACRYSAGPVPQLKIDEARWLISHFGCNLRAMEGFLYEQVQRQAFSDGEMRFIG